MESHQQHLILAQEVVMEEKITKKEVLEKVRQIIKKNEENEMEEIEEERREKKSKRREKREEK
mgnify:FL=1